MIFENTKPKITETITEGKSNNGVHLQLQQHITIVVFHPKDVCILQFGCFSLGGSLDMYGYDFPSVIVSVILGFVFSNIINVFSFTPFQHKCYWQE
jgi:hypothetical protein